MVFKMEQTASLREKARWYSSYMTDDQGKALIETALARITEDDQLLASIITEIELSESPKEENPETILQSIKAMIESRKPVSKKIGYSSWTA